MYDLAVIGGGVNGAGIARDAAGRGLSVLLLERDDLASHTSSAATKLIHGGLRYLEQYEFGLVRKALKEREILLASAPHIISPLRFVLPVDTGMRPAWMLRAGLFLYDHIGGKSSLPGTGRIDLHGDAFGSALQDRLETGFGYSDAWVDDARLVVLSAMDAAERGADIRTRTECTALTRHADRWNVEARHNSEPLQFEARALVNAAGPWVEPMARMAHDPSPPSMRLVKGSHIVTRRLFEGDHAFIFQNADGRVIFAIPYEANFTLIGTTERPWRQEDGPPKIAEDEIDYLLAAVGEYLRDAPVREDVVWSYAGVRPLIDDQSASASAVTRDYAFDVEQEGGAPLLSVLGGKLTTFRLLAENAVSRLAPLLGCDAKGWTADAVLPGGDFTGGVDTLARRYLQRWPWLGEKRAARFARSYGTRTPDLMATGRGDSPGMGMEFGDDLSAVEVNYLHDKEYARTSEDILWRRTKLGLHLDAAQIHKLRVFMNEAN